MLIPRHYNSLSNETKEEWRKTYGKSVNETIRGYLLDLIGKPLEKILDNYSIANFMYFNWKLRTIFIYNLRIIRTHSKHEKSII